MSYHTIARRGAVAAVFACIAVTAACGTEPSVVGQPPNVVASVPGDHTIDVPDPYVHEGRPISEK